MQKHRGVGVGFSAQSAINIILSISKKYESCERTHKASKRKEIHTFLLGQNELQKIYLPACFFYVLVCSSVCILLCFIETN